MNYTFKKITHRITFLFLICTPLTFTECKKENDPEPTSELVTINAGAVKTYQAVTFNISDGTLKTDSCEAKFNESLIYVYKIDDTSAFVIIPVVIPGTYTLKVPTLNRNVHFDVTETILVNTPDEIRVSMTQTITNALVNVSPTSPERASAEALLVETEKAFNSSTDTEKEEFAKYMIANKKLFDDISALTTVIPAPAIRTAAMSLNDIRLVIAYTGSYFLIHTGLQVAWKAPNPIGVGIGLGAVAVGIGGLKFTFDEMIDGALRRIQAVNLEAASTPGANMRTQSLNTLSFEDKKQKTYNVILANHSLIASDESADNGYVNMFFSTTNGLNEGINTLNSMITYVNDAIFFSTIPLVPNVEVPAIPVVSESVPLENAVFSNTTFTVNHSSLILSTPVNMGNGDVRFTLTLKPGITITNDITTSMSISYKDDFNNYTTTIPVVFTKPGPTQLYSGTYNSYMVFDYKNRFVNDCYTYNEGFNIPLFKLEIESNGNNYNITHIASTVNVHEVNDTLVQNPVGVCLAPSIANPLLLRSLDGGTGQKALSTGTQFSISTNNGTFTGTIGANTISGALNTGGGPLYLTLTKNP